MKQTMQNNSYQCPYLDKLMKNIFLLVFLFMRLDSLFFYPYRIDLIQYEYEYNKRTKTKSFDVTLTSTYKESKYYIYVQRKVARMILHYPHLLFT